MSDSSKTLDSALDSGCVESTRTNRALVLGGGGSKGAYHIGAYQALCELGYRFELITGVSIGALNGAMIAQGDFACAKALWENLRLHQVIKQGLNLTTDMEYYFDNAQKIVPFLKAYASHKGMNTAPLWEIINANLNYSKLASSPMDFGLLCLEVPSFQVCEKTKAQLLNPYLPHWVMASASCFPAFPIYEIQGRNYIDGGYYDNLPIDLAFKMGAHEVVAISLRHDYESKYDTNPLVCHIRPSRYLGTMLDFSPESIAQNTIQGYIDTKRYYGAYCGKDFVFQCIDSTELDRIARLGNALLRFLLLAELKNDNTKATSAISRLSAQLANTGILSKITSTTPFCDMLLRELSTRYIASNAFHTSHTHTISSHNAPHIVSLDISVGLVLMLVESFLHAFSYDAYRVYDVGVILEEIPRVLDSNTSASFPFKPTDKPESTSELESANELERAFPNAYALLHSTHRTQNLAQSHHTALHTTITHIYQLLRTTKPDVALFSKTPQLHCALLLCMLRDCVS